MKQTICYACVIIGALFFLAQGGEVESPAVIQPKISHYSYAAIPKDPLASAFFSATIPGTGQIYNKEYLRGVYTGIAFWGGLFTAEWLLYKWQRINTDTVFFQELDKDGVPTGSTREVYIMRDPKNQVGLLPRDKALLISSVAIGAAAYIFGIIDSYAGAQRYNKRLFADASIRPELYCSLGSKQQEAGLRLRF